METGPEDVVIPLLDARRVQAMLRDLLDEKLAGLETRLLSEIRRNREAGQSPQDLRAMLNEKQLAELLGCDPRTIRRLECSGEIPPAVRIGRSKRWSVNHLRSWLERKGSEANRWR